MFPIITKEIQSDFEKSNIRLESVPTICGILGRGCRRIGDEASAMPCIDCGLALFAALEQNLPVYKVTKHNGRGRKNFVRHSIITDANIKETFKAYGYELKEVYK